MHSVEENKLGKENIGKLLFSMALPAIAAQVINLLYNLVDRVYIGHIPDVGAMALTGVGVTFPLVMLIAAFAALVSMGGAPKASIMMGKGDKESAENILGNSTTALVIVSIVITIIIKVFGRDILMLFGASENTIGYGLDYIGIYAYGTMFVQLALGLNAFITAQGFAKISMMTVTIGAVINIVLDPIFIFYFNMGVKGAAIATIISQGISAIWVIRFLTGEKTLLRIKKEYLKLDMKILLPTLALGLSPFIMQSTESLITVIFNSSLQKYGGDLAVGAMTILTSVMQFSLLPLVGLTQGSQPIISYNYGARNKERVKKGFLILLLTTIAYSTTIWALVMFFPQIFIGAFTSNADLMSLTIPSIRIFMAVSLVFGIQIACQQTFISLGNAKVSIFLALLRKLILLIPLIYILPLFFEDKVMAIFLAEPVADFIAVTVTSILFAVQFRNILNEMDSAEV